MKRIILLLLAVFIIGSLTWYATWNGIGSKISKSMAKSNRENIVKVELGMTKVDLIKLMGRPERAEAYTYNKRIIEFMFYRINGFDSYFKDPKENFVPIAIENKNALVLSWGWEFYNEVLRTHGK